jgi:hypothetical protein
MINRNENPVEWVLLLDELDEAHDHLGDLIAQMTAEPDYDEARLQLNMGHIMAHLNRAWAKRSYTRALTDQEWEAFRNYPQDLPPIA